MPDDTLVQQDTLDTSTTRDTINLNNGGVPLLNSDGKIYDAYLPTITGAVTSVNGQTGNVIVNAGDVSYNSTSKKLTYNQGASSVDELNIGSAVSLSNVSLSNGVITTNDLRSSTATFSSNITTPKIYGGSSSSSYVILQPNSSSGSAALRLYSTTSPTNIVSIGASDGGLKLYSSEGDVDVGSGNNINITSGEAGTANINLIPNGLLTSTVALSVAHSSESSNSSYTDFSKYGISDSSFTASLRIGIPSDSEPEAYWKTSNKNINIQPGALGESSDPNYGTYKFLYNGSEVITKDNASSSDIAKLNINKYNSEGYMPDGASGTAPDMSNSMNNMGFYVAAYYPLGNNVFRIWLSDKQQEMLLADDADGSGFTNKAGNAAEISYETSESNLETVVKQFAEKIRDYYQSAISHPEVYFTFYNDPQCENGIKACPENQDFWKNVDDIRTAIIVEAVFTGSNKGFPPERYTVNELKGDPWRYGLVVSTPINPVEITAGSYLDFQSLGLVDFTLTSAVVGHNNRLLSLGTYAVGKEHSVLGMYSSAFGRSNEVYTYCSLASGQGNTTTCEKSFISGSFNTLEYGINSAALGWRNVVTGSKTPRDQTSNFAIGTYNSVTNTTTNTSSFAIGNYIENTVSTKLSVGKYNYDNPNNIFEVGCGSGDANRNNAFEVNTDGNTTIGGNLTVTGSKISIGSPNALNSSDNRQIAIGYNNTISSSGNGRKIAFGGSNTLSYSAIDSCVIGYGNQLYTTGSYAFGTKLYDFGAQSDGTSYNIRRNIFLFGCNNYVEDLTTNIGSDDEDDKARIAFGVGVSYNDVKKTGLMISEAGNLWLGGSIINMLGSDNNRYRLSIDVTGGNPTLVITPAS